ncbi:hypothetical protein V6259_03630 [Marinomonas sp. TI.3.20]|uniref:hypothetical protein n=1 Tax=Marinomonas sp. TI.3.20 TaxID=3121296 RepID=UPI00311F263F
MAFLKKNLIWFLFVISLFLLLISSNEALPKIFHDNFIGSLFSQFSVGNTIIFNLSIGYIVSLIFYVLVVVIPEKRKNKELKEKLGQPISFVLEAFCYDKSILNGIFHWSKHVINCRPISEHLGDLNQFKNDANYKKLQDARSIIILQAADEILPTFEQLVPVAFQVSHHHAMVWLSLTNSIRQLARLYNTEHESRDWGVLDLNLKEFVEYTELFYSKKS